MRKVKLHNPFKSRRIDEDLLREHLALERTKLANERTLLSYIRASLYLLLGGLALLQIKKYEEMRWIGYLSIFISIVFIGIGISRYFILGRKLHKLLRTGKKPEKTKNSS
ncbi:MAG: DUF202 domain-containing protein [Salegentibacter sp.]